MVLDPHQPVIFSRLRYHRQHCHFVARSTKPVSGARWESIYRLTAPCSSCLPPGEMNWWLERISASHLNCAPISRLLEPNKRSIGRPRAINPEAYRRILIHRRGKKSLKEIAEAIQESDGVSCTRQTVWRAINFYPPYNAPAYRQIAEELGFMPHAEITATLLVERSRT